MKTANFFVMGPHTTCHRMLHTAPNSAFPCRELHLFSINILAAVILASIAVMFGGNNAFAQTATNQIVVSPAKLELLLDPGEEATKQIQITNGLSKPVTLRVFTEDIGPSSDPLVGASLLGEGEGSYSLKHYIYPLIQSFSIKPGETVALPVTVRLSSDVSPGGRFGAVIFSLLSDDNAAGGAQTIVDTRVGTSIFVRAKSGAIEKGSITEFSSRNHQSLYFGTHPAFVVTFKNEGNVHLNPYGGIIIRNIFGLEKTSADITPWFVLPGSTRTQVKEVEDHWLFGAYKAELVLNPGYGDEQAHEFVWLWIFSRDALVVLGIIIITVFVGIALYRKRKKHL